MENKKRIVDEFDELVSGNIQDLDTAVLDNEDDNFVEVHRFREKAIDKKIVSDIDFDKSIDNFMLELFQNAVKQDK